MKTVFQKGIALTVIFVLTVLMCSGCKRKFDINSFEKHENTTTITHTFSNTDESEKVIFDESSLHRLRKTYLSQPVTYGYDELFNYEEAIPRIKSGYVVENHARSALDENGKLTAEHLFEIVRKNNDEYLENKVLLKDVDDKIIHRICEIIVETTNDILEKYPDIDRDRVYCNLGNLKIIEKGSALDFAAIEPGMVLHINKHTAKTVNVFSSSNMYSVIVHETMHIIQFGCECEQIENLLRRCGIAYAYSDLEQDTTDCLWLSEGSAERMACMYTNVEPMTYKNHVNYILSLELATILKDDIPANYVETISFYNDLDRLFMLFDATSEAEKKEIYHMLYSLEIIQQQPTDVMTMYEKIYGEEWNDEIRDIVNHKLKRPVVQTITKQFYNNLIDAVINKSLTKNDVLFLLNLFDSTINYHLVFNNSNNEQYNSEFVNWYTSVESTFFDSLENVSIEDYSAYQSYDKETKTVNASINWLDEDKKNFLLEKFEDHFCDYKFLTNPIEQ